MSTQTTHGSGAQSPTGSVGAVGQETKGAAADVAGTATQETKKVAREATDQARQLFQQARSDLTGQASSQQDRAAQGLRQLSEQLRSMAGGTDEGMAKGLVDDVARRAGDAASFLEQRDPGALLDEVRTFAQRRPGAFLAIAAGLGVVAGRMSRSIVDEKREEQGSSGGSPQPLAPMGTGEVYTSGEVYGTGSLGGTGVPSAGMPSATAPTVVTTESTPLSPGSSRDASAAGAATLPGEGLPGPHGQTQPIGPDGTPTPITEEGMLGAPSSDPTYRGDR